jgi:hypothetical protein
MSNDPREKRCWRFQCPERGVCDADFGDLATAEELMAEELYCEVCLSEDGKRVTLRRWIVAEEPLAT